MGKQRHRPCFSLVFKSSPTIIFPMTAGLATISLPRCLKFFLLACLGLAAVPNLVRADEKPVVYNKADGGFGSLDEMVHKVYAEKYTVKDLSTDEGYTSPKAVSGDIPSTAKADSGDAIPGYVLVAYVSTADGTASDATVLSSTDDRLDKIALNATKSFRLAPGTLKGAAISTTAVQEFVFNSEEASRKTSTDHIILYQKDDVLAKRLPEGAKPLATYIKRLLLVYGGYLPKAGDRAIEDIVVAVRPGQRSRVWFVPGKTPPAPGDLAVLKKKLEAVAPMEVSDGPVIFAISSAASTPQASSEDFQLPLPAEWNETVKKLEPGAGMDKILEAVWPAKP